MIALVIPLFGTEQRFTDNLVISLCIGYSINLFTILGHNVVRQYVHSLLITVFGFAAGTPAGLTLAGWLLQDMPSFFFVGASSPLFISLFFGALGAALINALWYLLDAKRRLQDAQLKQLQQEKLLLESELRSLQAQIEPHFLFNTLANTIGLITTAPAQAISMLENLTSLLRSTLRRTRNGNGTLEQELNVLEAYLAIQKIRLGSRLRYEISCDEALHQHPLSPLLLQPLVENAVMHGIEPNEGGGLIQILVSQENQMLNVKISNTGAPFTISKTHKKGYGIANVEQRLFTLYGKQAKLRIAQTDANVNSNSADTVTYDGDRTIVHLMIPLP